MAGIISCLLLAATPPEGAGARAVAEAVHTSLVPSHSLALWIMRMIRRMLDFFGLTHNDTIEEIIYTAIVLGVALLIGMIVRTVIVFAARKMVKLRHSQASKLLLSQRVLKKCSHIIPPLVFLALIPFAFSSDGKTLGWILRIVGVYTLVTFAIAICAVLEYAWIRFDERENTENHPLKGILNVCRGLVWIIIVILSVSVLIDKSPLSLLAGLGAFAAALMLIFKDSILGFVAGIQLSQNDMLRVGDWITVPSTNANGIVMDVTLTVVKVQNFDNTMVMLPPYTLVSTSFQNWRNMFEVGFRMIDHNIFIDRSSVVLTTQEQIASLRAKFPLLDEFIAHQEAARKAAAPGSLHSGVQQHSRNQRNHRHESRTVPRLCLQLSDSSSESQLPDAGYAHIHGSSRKLRNCPERKLLLHDDQLGPVRSSEGRDNRTSHRRSRRIRTADLQQSRPEHLLPAEGRSRARLHGTQSRSHLTAAMNPPDASRRPDCRLFSFFS